MNGDDRLDGPVVATVPVPVAEYTAFIREATAAARLAVELSDPDAAKAILRGVAVVASPLVVMKAEP